MSKIAIVGLGKLGYPVAVAMAYKGHQVIGYDTNIANMTYDPRPYKETGPDGEEDFNKWFQEFPYKSHLLFYQSLEELLLDEPDIIFIAVQTPHKPEFEGITPLPKARSDFDYSYLQQAVIDIGNVLEKETPVVIISTVLPGTIRREMLPFCSPKMKLCYNPFFIAMGTTMRDFLYPEFVLFGKHDSEAARVIEEFYKTITDALLYVTSIENAEAIKVFYNTFLSTKLAFVNTVMEIAHKIPGCNVDEITDGLKMATDRLISPKYMSGGMGDGGNCHPRDNIALSFLAKKLHLSYDFFGSVMEARERQTEWLADIVIRYHRKNLMKPILLLGYSYKPEINLTGGSCALLLKNLIEEKGYKVECYDPFVDSDSMIFCAGRFRDNQPHVFFIGTKHQEFVHYKFPEGSIVIDPWRYIPGQAGVEVIRIGEG